MFLPMLYYGPKQIVVFLLQFFQLLQCMHHFDRHLLSIMPPLADLSKSGSFASSIRGSPRAGMDEVSNMFHF